jgi:putative FmdB family regulatory protein
MPTTTRKSTTLPTYDYQCRDCGNTIEVIHPMAEDGPSKCEVCGGPLRRILFPAGIIFKGSGFYKTDSRSSSSASVPAGSKPASPSSDSAGSSSSKADAGGGSSTTGESKPSKGSSSPSVPAGE